MNQAEFNRWWSDYSLRFPDTGEWVRKQPRAGELMEVWAEALAGTNLSDALEVNRLLTKGELERWKTSSGYHEREETPAMIRKMVWERRRDRGDFQQKHETPDPNIQPSAFPIGILFRQLVACNERWAKNPDFDKQSEHKRLQNEFLAKYSAKPARNREAAFDSYNAS